MKNIDFDKVLKLEDQVQYHKGQIVSKTLQQNEKVSMTLFSFYKGEEISSHESNGDAMVMVLDGKGKFTVGDKEHIAQKGQTLVMPKKIPHAVIAEENFKMLLIVVF
ncbi:MAG: cupin domain-containing protein [Bacillota bacterium]